MTVHLTSGPARIVATGTATTWFGHPLDLHLEEPDGSVRVRLVFRTDATDSAVRVTPTKHDDGWLFEAINFDQPDGRGTSDPVLLGAIGDDLVFLHFRVFRYGQTPDHTVHYTFHRAPASRDAATSSEVP